MSKFEAGDIVMCDGLVTARALVEKREDEDVWRILGGPPGRAFYSRHDSDIMGCEWHKIGVTTAVHEAVKERVKELESKLEKQPQDFQTDADKEPSAQEAKSARLVQLRKHDAENIVDVFRDRILPCVPTSMMFIISVCIAAIEEAIELSKVQIQEAAKAEE